MGSGDNWNWIQILALPFSTIMTLVSNLSDTQSLTYNKEGEALNFQNS